MSGKNLAPCIRILSNLGGGGGQYHLFYAAQDSKLAVYVPRHKQLEGAQSPPPPRPPPLFLILGETLPNPSPYVTPSLLLSRTQFPAVLTAACTGHPHPSRLVSRILRKLSRGTSCLSSLCQIEDAPQLQLIQGTVNSIMSFEYCMSDEYCKCLMSVYIQCGEFCVWNKNSLKSFLLLILFYLCGHFFSCAFVPATVRSLLIC